jgi:transglutaminase-like putative cysteine protease
MNRCAGLIAMTATCATLGAVAPVNAAQLPQWLRVNDKGIAERIEADLEQIDPASGENPRGYEETLHRTHHRLRADGDVETMRTIVRTFLAEPGLEHATVSLPVLSDFEDVELLHLYVLHSDGTRSIVDPSTIQITTETTPDLYSDIRNVVVPFPAVRVGSRSIFVVREVKRQSAWPLGWSTIRSPLSLARLREFSVRVDWDPGVPAPLVATDIEPTPCKRSERTIQCRMVDIGALQLDDNVESYLDLVPRIVFSTVPTWNAASLEEYELVTRSTEVTPAIRDRAGQITADLHSDEDRIAALHRYVADEVRYVGLEHGTAAVAPTRAEVTARLGYGDCKGKVALFLALARSLNLEAEGALVATNRFDLDRLIAPSSNYFDHMIVCAPRAEPGAKCIDLTAPRLPTGLLPLSILGAVALPIRAGDAAPFTLDRPEFAWDVRLRSTTEIQCDATLVERTERTYRGHWAVSVRESLRLLTREEQTAELVEAYQETVSDNVTPTVKIEGLEDESAFLTVHTETRFEDPTSDVRDWTHYTEGDPWLKTWLSSMMTTNRIHPYRQGGLRYDGVHDFTVCEGAEIQSLGPTLELVRGFGAMRRTYTKTAGSVSAKTQLHLKASRLDNQEERDRFNRFISTLKGQSRLWFDIGWQPSN